MNHHVSAKRVVLVLFFACLFAGQPALSTAQAAEWTSGGAQPGKWMFGFRAGFAPLTQSLTANFSTDVGSLVNLQGMYALNKWLLLGLTLEWERHAVDRERPHIDLGHQDTVSLLPTIEVRPGKIGPISPYASMGLGVNVNSFGESEDIGGSTISPSNTLAWRLAWGLDYHLTSHLALNTEMAYKRNDGHATVNGIRVDDWNASSFGFLFGLRLFL
ncbi:MAG: hypothetical protein C4293_16410 [Nitrospiraceae bacterium]